GRRSSSTAPATRERAPGHPPSPQSLASGNKEPGRANAPRADRRLIAEFAGREVTAVDGRLEELLLVELPELGDVWIGLDHRIPELFLVVAEHLLLFDLLDVDVLYWVAHLVDADGAPNRIQLERGELFHEFLLTREVALIVLDDLVDHLRRRVVRLRVI